MSEADRRKWDQRYREDTYRKTNPVTLLGEWAPRIGAGRALDVACGAGRNALYLAREGFSVDAIDISSEGLALARAAAAEEGLAIRWIEHDLDLDYDFAGGYRLIVVLWYVNLPLIERLSECLAPGGFLLSEQHLRVDEEVIGPGSPAFRVEPGALRAAAAGLEVVHYREAVEPVEEGGHIASAQLVARAAR